MQGKVHKHKEEMERQRALLRSFTSKSKCVIAKAVDFTLLDGPRMLLCLHKSIIRVSRVIKHESVLGCV